MVNERVKSAIQDRADHNNSDLDPTNIKVGSQVWLYLDRVKEGYARKLAHMLHGPFRVTELCGECAVRLEIAGTPYRLFPVVHISKLKQVRNFSDRPTNTLKIPEEDRVDFDEAILPEDSWEGELEDEEFEVEKIADVRSERKIRFERVHRQFLVYWKGYTDPSWVDEADLNCGALLLDFDRTQVSNNRFEAMQSR